MTVPIIIDTHPLFTEHVCMNLRYLLLVFTLTVVEANAGSTLDAAIGGGLGGAAGAAIGNEIGGRDGAVIGGALGGAVGAAVNTDKEPRHSTPHTKTYYRDGYPQHVYPPRTYRKTHYIGSHPQHVYPRYRFCPPGQAKKGRC